MSVIKLISGVLYTSRKTQSMLFERAKKFAWHG